MNFNNCDNLLEIKYPRQTVSDILLIKKIINSDEQAIPNLKVTNFRPMKKVKLLNLITTADNVATATYNFTHLTSPTDTSQSTLTYKTMGMSQMFLRSH